MSLDRLNQFKNLTLEEKFTFELLKRRIEERYPELEKMKNKDNVYNLMLIFLRCKKFNVDGAFRKLSGLYSCTAKYPDIFRYINPDSAAEMLKQYETIVLKAPDKFGGALTISKVGTYDPNYGPCELLISLACFIAFHVNLSPEVQTNGVTAIYDNSGVGWKIAKNFGPSMFYKSADLIISAMPWKINGVHIVNASPISRKVTQAFKVVCPKKIADRFHIHSSLDSLHEELSPDILPKFLGGKLTDEEAGQDEYRNLELLSPEIKKFYTELLSYATL